jgi:hypothetical protein
MAACATEILEMQLERGRQLCCVLLDRSVDAAYSRIVTGFLLEDDTA